MFNAKTFLKEVLNVPEILSLTADKDIYFLHANYPNPPYIEYEIFNENGALWAEGEEIDTNFYIQIDIFSKGDYTDLEAIVREKMESAGFERDMSADLYESQTQLFHKAMRFNITN